MTSDASDHRSKISWVALLILFGVWGLHAAVDLVIFKEAEVPPYYDAANHTNIAMEIRDHFDRFEPSLAWFDELYEISSYYPPCYHLFAAVCLKIRPQTLDSVRLPNLFFLGVLMLSVYLLGNLLFDSKTGLLAGILISLFPVVHGLTREIYVDLAVLAWSAAGAYLVLASDRFGRKGIAFLFGVVCGFGLLTKWTFPVFIGFPVLWVFSGMFLPVAPGRFISGFFSNIAEEDRGADLYRAGLFLVGWVGVLYCFVSLFRGSGSFIFLSVLSLVFIGLLIGAAKQLSFSRGFASHWDEARRPTPPLASSLIGIVIASIPALLIAGPWYLKHFGFIASEGSRVLTEAAQVRGMAEVQTLDSMLYYFLTLESHQLRLPLWLLAIASILTILFGKNRNPSAWFLLGTFGLSYLVMSSLWVKDPRYFTPAIYPIPILIAWWLLSRSPGTRPVWLVGTLAVALIGYANQVIGLPGLSKRVEVPTPFGQPLTLAGPAPYGDMLRFDADWPHRSMVEEIQKDRDHVSHIEGRIEVPVLVDDGYLHAPALNCYAKMLGANLDFFNIAYRPDYRADPGSTRRLLNVLRAPYFITKQGGDLGPDFVSKNYEPLLKKLFGEESGWGEGRKPLAVYHLPDGATSTLWKNQFPAALLGERVKTDVKFANGVRVTGYRFSKRDLYEKGEATLLQVDWVPEPVENLESMVAGTQFFLHLQDPRDGRFIQGWNFPLTEEGAEVANFQVRSGSPPAVLSTLLIEPRKDLLPGMYEWRLGLFKSDSLAKVAIADPVGKV
ncbi:MAG: glycosyltransferase family 39 protein, partial [Candidatus Omnitrophica bacterium]|nr:glycosyltransferase family 39 protein [Candidatus Omnitrophota bacterium]